VSRCEKCPLRLKGKYFISDLFSRIPLPLRRMFICDDEEFIKKQSEPDLFADQKTVLCPADLWVLTFIGVKDKLAIKHAEFTLDKLVRSGASELLCQLFENAAYEIRRDLWIRMTELYPDRLYLFDAIFERDCLPCINTEKENLGLHLYQYSILNRGAFAAALSDDL
jgi:hypothetical protein